ncbi:MAG: hypothetical protein ACJ74G_08685 [Blastocatellia bacterium]
MKRLLMICMVCLLVASAALAAQSGFEHCLPPGIKAGTVVSAQGVQTDAGNNLVKKVMVRDHLTALKAHCRRGKLVDGKGREIAFYRLKGCWGNPPANYQEILTRQNEEIEKLKKRYTVITLTCNPDGMMIQ